MSAPAAGTFTSSSLRNRTRVAVEAPVGEVWALIGNLARFAEYSSGLQNVEAKEDPTGACTEYVCHFKRQEQGGESISHRELIRWYATNHGWASTAEEPNAFGLTDSLTLVTLDHSNERTNLTWDQYYECDALDVMKAEFDLALADISEDLVRRFGGVVVEGST